MMKDEIKICKYDKIDADFDAIIELHRLISKDTNLHKHLIYFDTNFTNYLTKIITQSKTDFFFVLKLKNVLVGFIHLKLIDDKIFLNNISIDSSFQGKGLGRLFLKESLCFLYDESQNVFELDVFKSNRNVMSWYQRLGLEVKSESIWRRIIKDSHEIDKNFTSEIIFSKDNNGFDSIFLKENKIASIVNNSTLIIHDLTHIEEIPIQKYFTITNQDINTLKMKNYQFINMEISRRMNGSIKSVLENINKKDA